MSPKRLAVSMQFVGRTPWSAADALVGLLRQSETMRVQWVRPTNRAFDSAGLAHPNFSDIKSFDVRDLDCALARRSIRLHKFELSCDALEGVSDSVPVPG